MKRLFLLLPLLLLTAFGASAQELNCKVSINHAQVQGTNTQVFTTLENALNEFVNGRKWSTAQYENNERIRCSMNITVKTYDETAGDWSCDLIVQAVRPVYQSGYQSVVFSFKDADFTFNYREYDQLEYRENQIDSNLVAVLVYYIYMMIGYDMDSMSPEGGTEMFRQAESIVNQSQSSTDKGWKAFDDSRNRYALVTDYLDNGMSPLRKLIYTYHRTGLDDMATNATRGRAAITEALPLLKEAMSNKPMSALPVLFTEVKRDELVNIYGSTSPASQSERETVYKLLSDINPSLNSDWSNIKSKR